MNKITLRNGVTIPCVGFGTWQVNDGDEAYNSVLHALRSGYTHIDTAAAYGNEESVGRAIKDSGIPREKLFITTKLWNDIRGYEETIEAFNESLKKLGLDYIDLYLIHWPNPVKYRENYIEMNRVSYKAMEDLYKQGKIRAIGVSNFLVHHLEELMEACEIIPMVNQIRLFPGLRQDEVIEYCKKYDIKIEAYSPFGTGKIFDVEELKILANKYNKSVAQICLRYSLEKGYIPLPKSVTPSRIESNIDIFDFSLDKEDLKLLDNLPNYVSPLKDIDNINY